MSSPAETKANTIYYLAKSVGEKILERKLPPLDFINPPPSNDTFQINAQTAYRELRESTDPAKRATAAIKLDQQLINNSHFYPARQLLRKFPDLTPGLTPEQRIHLNASQQEKYGWIADAETGYGEAQQRFWLVKKLLNQLPVEKWPDDFKNLDSTATHFGARAKLGLASQGINVQYNLRTARADFLQDLAHFQQLRETGNPHPFNEGFQYGWLAVGSIKEKQPQRALEEIAQAEQVFQEGLQEHPESGILAHTHLLRGLWHLDQHQPVLAREQLTEAVRIRSEVEKYPLGLAFAQIGISASFLQEKAFGKSFDYLKQAINTQPGVLLYMVNGRMLG